MSRLKPKSARFDLGKIDVEHFLEVMEVENLTKATEEEWQFSCPFPGHVHGDQSPSAYMNAESTAWMCHGCKRSGNALTFLSEMENVTIQQARSMLRNQYGGASPDPDHYSVSAELERYWSRLDRDREPAEFDVYIPEEVNTDFLIEWSRAEETTDAIPPELQYMFDRGFDAETLEHWEIGYDDGKGRITIPVRDHDGKLVGIKGRAWKDGHKPKYLVMGGDGYDYPRYHKSKIVFGLNHVLDTYRCGDDMFRAIPELILCEGELDVISLHEKGFDNAVCVAGSAFSETQSRLIRRFADGVVIFFDSDQGGHDGVVKVIEMLAAFMPLKVVPDHEGDPNEMTAEQIQQCLDESETIAKVRLLQSGG